MLDQLHIIVYSNLITTVCYVLIAVLVGVNLWTERARGINALSLTVFGIFVSCALHHGIHAEHVLEQPGVFVSDPNRWHQTLGDLFLIIPAVSFLSLRRRYGLLAKGEGVMLDYEKIVDRQKSERTAITNAMLDALFTVDGEGNVVSVNHYAAELLGYNPNEMFSRPFSAFFVDPAQAQDGLEKAKQGDLQGYEAQLKCRDGGSVLAAFNARAIRDPKGNVEMLIIVGRDIREQKKMEAALRDYSGQLEAQVQNRTHELSEVNHELDSFAYSISHDLRAPLRGISGFAEALQEDYGSQLDEEGRRYLERVMMGTKRMSNLIEDLLSFSRLTRRDLNIRRVDAGNMVQNALADFELEIQKRGVHVEVGELPTVTCDPAIITQVFQNLISNVLKYSKQTGGASIKIGCETKTDQYTFYVEDKGIGFDPVYEEKIWQTFQRLHTQEEYEGTGIGLAIVRRIVERHGGQTWAVSGDGQGATFYFSLPIKPQQQAPQLNAAGDTAQGETNPAPKKQLMPDFGLPV